jgi:polyhydroxybutyrate depolymerase
MGISEPRSAPVASARVRARGLAKLLLGLTAAAIIGAAPAAAEMQRRSIDVNGTARDYLLFVPEQRPDSGRGVPLVVVLHGGTTVADMILHYTGFNRVGERENIAIAYPYGLNRWWNDGRYYDGRGESNADDVGFMRALVADVGNNVVPIDPARRFATGISNGGFMSLRLACEASDLFAAVAAVSATMPQELGARCRPGKPVPVLVVNGTADPMVPYVGGIARAGNQDRGAVWSTENTIAFWARRNGCAAPAVMQVLPDVDSGDGSYVIEADYRGCFGAPVKLLRVEGGGHTWPGGPEFIPASLLGTTNRDIDATETIWDFFKAAMAAKTLPPTASRVTSPLQPVSTTPSGRR